MENVESTVEFLESDNNDSHSGYALTVQPVDPSQGMETEIRSPVIPFITQAAWFSFSYILRGRTQAKLRLGNATDMVEMEQSETWSTVSVAVPPLFGPAQVNYFDFESSAT